MEWNFCKQSLEYLVGLQNDSLGVPIVIFHCMLKHRFCITWRFLCH